MAAQSRITRLRRHGVLVTTTITDAYESFVKRSLVQNEILYYLNFSAAIVQAISGIVIIINASDTKYTIYSTFRASAPPDASGAISSLTPVPKELFSVSIESIITAYLFISSLNHLLVCMKGKKAYERGLKHDYNIFRWIEFSFSASLMKVIIGLLCGIIDLNSLILIFGLSSVTMILGLIFELENSGKRMDHLVKWHVYWAAFIPHTFLWVVILTYLAKYTTDDNARGFVRPFIIIIFLLDITFPIVLGLQWRAKGLFRLYATGEIVFTILSLIIKNALAWMIYGVN